MEATHVACLEKNYDETSIEHTIYKSEGINN